MIRAVFLDAGHTLVYAYPEMGAIYSEVTAGYGPSVPPDRFREVFVPVFKGAVKRYASEGEASDAQDRAMWRTITREIYDRLDELKEVEFDRWFEGLYDHFGKAESWRMYDDVVPTLRALRERGVKLGIVSNWDTRLRGICTGLGLDRLVDFIVISAEVGCRKPDPRIFEEALRRAEVKPSEALHVGDLPDEDAVGAQRAGIRPLLIDRRRRMVPADPLPGVEMLETLADLDRYF